MTARSIERLWVRLLWAISLVVIVRWLVIHKVDRGHGAERSQRVFEIGNAIAAHARGA